MRDKAEYCNAKLRSWLDVQKSIGKKIAGNEKGKYLGQMSKSFPFYTVLDCYRELGKHFVPDAVCQTLADIHNHMKNEQVVIDFSKGRDHQYDHTRLLMDFLCSCIDKHLNVYEYKSYIALPVFLDNSLPLRSNFISALLSRVSLFKALLYDNYLFEARSFLGHEIYTQDRRSDLVIIQRLQNITRALTAFADIMASICGVNPDERATLSLLEDCHLGLIDGESVSRGIATVEMLREINSAELQLPISLILDLSMLPVFVNHEEYNFIRMLQVFEVIFSIVILGLEGAINFICESNVKKATYCLKILCSIFRIDVHLFRILKTMPKEDFQIFRNYTEGASAIQSPQYKMIEVLIGKPSTSRLDSPAFRYVPEIRVFLERSGLSLEQVLRSRYPHTEYGIDIDSISTQDDFELLRQINLLDNAILDWKKRHFGIAHHMIGTAKGTGDTDGISYLAKFKQELFFPALEFALRKNRPVYDTEVELHEVS